jgi:hypothetical protein
LLPFSVPEGVDPVLPLPVLEVAAEVDPEFVVPVPVEPLGAGSGEVAAGAGVVAGVLELPQSLLDVVDVPLLVELLLDEPQLEAPLDGAGVE